MNHESNHTIDAAKKKLNASLLELFERLQAVKHAGVRI